MTRTVQPECSPCRPFADPKAWRREGASTPTHPPRCTAQPPIHASKVGFSIRPPGDMKVTLCGLSTMPARAGPRWHAQKRGAGSGIASLGDGSSEMARNQIRVRRGIVVSCLQQAALFALDYDCVPRIDHDRRNDPPPVVCGIEEQRERVERHLPRLGWIGSQQGPARPIY